MTNAAVLAALGLPAHRYLTTDDRSERLVLEAVAHKGQEVLDAMHHNLAGHVIAALARAMRR